MTRAAFLLALFFIATPTLAQSTPQHPLPPRPADNLSSSATIVPANEPGDPLVIDGQVFAPDGTTPVPGVDIHAYNTDAQGFYGANHSFYPPRIQGWAKTDAEGRFQFRTIRPGHYPGMRIPAHVHFGLWGAGYPFQYAGEVRFVGDAFLSEEDAARAKTQGKFSDIVPIEKDKNGVWHVRINLEISRTSNFPAQLPNFYR